MRDVKKTQTINQQQAAAAAAATTATTTTTTTIIIIMIAAIKQLQLFTRRSNQLKHSARKHWNSAS